ncbi:unnamed protein product, partial [Ectocarpus sp. 8 AP-2014]
RGERCHTTGTVGALLLLLLPSLPKPSGQRPRGGAGLSPPRCSGRVTTTTASVPSRQTVADAVRREERVLRARRRGRREPNPLPHNLVIVIVLLLLLLPPPAAAAAHPPGPAVGGGSAAASATGALLVLSARQGQLRDATPGAAEPAAARPSLARGAVASVLAVMGAPIAAAVVWSSLPPQHRCSSASSVVAVDPDAALEAAAAAVAIVVAVVVIVAGRGR